MSNLPKLPTMVRVCSRVLWLMAVNAGKGREEGVVRVNQIERVAIKCATYKRILD